MSKKNKKNFLIVDTSSFLYRAYHAMPDLRNKNNFPTGALTGIINMLRKTKEEWPCNFAVCVFDPKGPTFRTQLYEEYKANRTKMPEDLSRQINVIFEIIAAMGWPILSVKGFEADDVIGTLATLALKNGMQSTVISGDKDLSQLVCKEITVVDTMKRDGASSTVLDTKGVHNKFGVEPNQIVDYLALLGDKVDNIPGVPKVGPKTAKKWIEEYGSLQEIIKNSDSIGGAVGENLRNSLEWLPKAASLVKIKTDVFIPEAEKEFDKLFCWKPMQLPEIKRIREEYNLFNSLKGIGENLSERNPLINKEKEKSVDKDYRLISTVDDLMELKKIIENSKVVAFDTETTSLNVREAKLVGISFSWDVGKAAYIPIAHKKNPDKQITEGVVFDALKEWFCGPVVKVAHNLKYDLHILKNSGFNVSGPFQDTMLMSYVLEANRKHDLSTLAKRHLFRDGTSYEDICGKGVKQICFSEVDIRIATDYSCEDADFTFDLFRELSLKLNNDADLFKVYNEIELPCLFILLEMENVGVKVSSESLEKQTHELKNKINLLEKKAYDLAGEEFNLSSPKQIGKILFEKLGYPPVKKTAGGSPSTDESVLDRLSQDYPLPRYLLDWRTLSKLKTTYTEKLPLMIDKYSKRIHTNFAQAVAVTGRLASNEPNLQNIPIKTEQGRKIREAFIPEKGFKIVSADYSQIELRIMAHLSGDAVLKKAFFDGQDVHNATASEIFSTKVDTINSEQRRTAKVINFGLIYGMGSFGLSKSLGISRDAASKYIDRYFQRYPGVAAFMETTKHKAKKMGYVQTLLGRKLWLPEINSPNGPRRQASERAAINAPMQGTAADLIKLAMIKVFKEMENERFTARMVMQVHDELVFEVLNTELEKFTEFVRVSMCNVLKLDVPLSVDVGEGDSWEEAH